MRKILFLDPGAFGVYYEYSLLNALSANLKRNIVYISSRYRYEKLSPPKGIRVFYLYFGIYGILEKIFGYKEILKIFKGIEYILDNMFLLLYILIIKPSIIHINWPIIPKIDLILIKWFKYLNFKIIYTVHDPLPHEQKRGDVDIFKKIYSIVDRIVVLSEYSRNQIRDIGIGEDKINLILHGDYDYIFDGTSENKKLSKKLQEMKKDKKIILFLGIIRPYKGLEVLIKTIRLLDNKKYFFIILGKPLNNKYKNLYTSLLNENEIHEKVFTDLRYIPKSDLISYMHISDIGVLPYVSASQSGNIITFYHFKVPVIATNVGGLPEMIDNGKTGLIVPPGDPVSLKNALVSILEDEETLKNMQFNSGKMIEEKFNWSKIIIRLENLYKELL